MLSVQQRRLLGAAAVVIASCSLVFAVRRTQKPYSPDAPAFRQKGPAEARVVIVEYSDFQCPACRIAEQPMRDVLKLYGKDVRFVYKHFPLERPHPWARPAAVASECAGRQGRFWEYHDLLYDKQEEWTKDDAPARLQAFAKTLKLDSAAFDACLKDKAADDAVAKDMKEGDDRWVGSTPTFFVNGKRFVGARQLQTRGTLWIERQLR